jgi:hypothetical protein
LLLQHGLKQRGITGFVINHQYHRFVGIEKRPFILIVVYPVVA